MAAVQKEKRRVTIGLSQSVNFQSAGYYRSHDKLMI